MEIDRELGHPSHSAWGGWATALALASEGSDETSGPRCVTLSGRLLQVLSGGLVAKLCLHSDSCDLMGWYSPPETSVHGIFQARIPEWGAISFSRGSF